MQLDADRYPLLYSIRGALSPARKNAKAARQAAAKRRAWTAEYSQLVFSLIDARREAEALREAGAPMTVPAGVAAGGLFDVPLPEPRLPSLGE